MILLRENHLRATVLIAVCLFFLAGCGRKANNAAIVSATQSKLEKSRNLNDYYVHVESRNGAVMLTGVVSSNAAKDEIDSLASSIGRTKNFSANLTVMMPSPNVPGPNDAAIKTSVQQKLSTSPSLAKQNIEVTSQGGVVTLKGYVANASERAQAEKLAEEVGGVTSVTNQLEVKLGPRPPTVTLAAAPSLIAPGKSALLRWSSHNAKTLDIEPGIGRVRPRGSEAVSPTRTTTYTLVGRGPAGQATAMAQVTVWNAVPPPKITASVSPSSVRSGQSVQLRWSSLDATSVDIEPGVGRVIPSGSTTVAPTRTTKYTLTATGQGGTETTTTLVTVAAGPILITIPPGTNIPVTLIDSIDSRRDVAGQTFAASLTSAVIVDNRIAIPQEADARVELEEVHRAGHFRGRPVLKVTLASITANGVTYNVQTSAGSKFGNSRGRNTAEKVGGGALIGGLLGALAGGRKGAVIGAGAGAGGGAIFQALTRGKRLRIRSETKLNFVLTSPLTVKLPQQSR